MFHPKSCQVRTKDLPALKEVLEPLLAAGSLGPLRTGDFKDGCSIQLLREVLQEVTHAIMLARCTGCRACEWLSSDCCCNALVERIG